LFPIIQTLVGATEQVERDNINKSEKISVTAEDAFDVSIH
jgi:hypothetical protein